MQKQLLRAIVILSIPQSMFSMNFYNDGIPLFGERYEKKEDDYFYIDGNKRLLNQGQLLQYPGQCYFYDHLKKAYYEDSASLKDDNVEVKLTQSFIKFFSVAISDPTKVDNSTIADQRYKENKRRKKMNGLLGRIKGMIWRVLSFRIMFCHAMRNRPFVYLYM